MAGEPFTVEIAVRFRDVDMMGHVNNAVYLTYMETARTEYYLRLVGRENAPRLPGEFDWIVARAAVDFRDAARLGETVVVTVWPSRIGEKSWTFSYRMVDKASGRLVAEAETVQVAFDYKARATRPLDARLRADLEAARQAAQRRGLAAAT